MFLQVPFPQGCRSHSSISAGKRTQLIERRCELRDIVLDAQTESCTHLWFCKASLRLRGHSGHILGTTQQMLGRAHVHPDTVSHSKGQCRVGAVTLTHAHGLLPSGLEAVMTDADVAALSVNTVPVAADIGYLLALIAT